MRNQHENRTAVFCKEAATNCITLKKKERNWYEESKRL